MVLAVGGAPVAAQGQAAPTAASAAAVLTVISGEVLTRSGSRAFAAAADGAVLHVGATVRTGADARAVLTLFEGSTVELEPGSDVTIEQAITRDGSTIVKLAQMLGRSWHVVTHLTTADSRYEVRTPAATASVRGTAFEVAVEAAFAGPMTTVTTTTGLVAATDSGATAEVLVASDQTTTVHSGAAPESPRSAPEARRVMTVTATSDASVVVDPLGRANGIKDGRVLAQTPGARVSMTDGTIVVTLPNVPDGVFATTVAPSSSPVAVSTSVTDRGEEPVTITSQGESGSTTTAVELRHSGDRSELRALTGDEMRLRSDAKAGANKGAKPSARPTRGAAPTPRSDPSQRAVDPSAQPAPTAINSPRRTPAPASSPARR